MTDPIRIALDRLHEYAVGHPNHDTDEIVAAARTALAHPAPPAEGDVTDAELNAMWNCSGIADEYGNHTGNIFEFARAAIALDRTRRAPVLKEKGICPACEGSPTAANNPCAVCGCSAAPPAEGEVGELVALIRQIALAWEPDACLLGNMTAGQLARAADLLEQRHPAPVPVPVNERLPGHVEQALIKAECALSDIAEGEPEENEGDSDALLSWAEQRAAAVLARIRPVMREHGIRTSEWPPLPAHSLPLPAGEVQP